MKCAFAVILCIAFPLSMFAADARPSYKVTYDGGSLPQVKAGAGMKLYIDATGVKFAKDKSEIVTIPGSSITEVSYGQDVHRRVGTAIGLGMISFGVGAFMLLAKSKKHFVGLTWANGNLGQNEKAVAEVRGAIALNPDNGGQRFNLADDYLWLNRLDEAKATVDQAFARKLDYPGLHDIIYRLSFLQNDVTGMQPGILVEG